MYHSQNCSSLLSGSPGSVSPDVLSVGSTGPVHAVNVVEGVSNSSKRGSCGSTPTKITTESWKSNIASHATDLQGTLQSTRSRTFARKGNCDTRVSKKASPKKKKTKKTKKTKKEPRFPTKPKAKNIDRNGPKLFFEVPISEWLEGRFMEGLDFDYDDDDCVCSFCQRSYCWADPGEHQRFHYYG